MAFPIALTSTSNLPSYQWGVDAGEVALMPSFQTSTSDLDSLIRWQSRPRIQVEPKPEYTLHFNPLECSVGPGIDDAVDQNANVTIAAAAAAAEAAGSRDCIHACGHGPSLFTPTNLRVCSMLAAAAVLVGNDTFEYSLSGDADSLDVAAEWRVPNLTAFDGAGVLENITRCISESCSSSAGLGSCTQDLEHLSGVEITAGSLEGVVGALGHYCDSLDSVLNTDIAGPGVILSYLLQTSLALLFYVLIKSFYLWPGRISHALGYFSPNLRQRGESLQARLASSPYGDAVVSSVVEFQEVQLYFVGSIQVATFVSFNPDNPRTGSANSTSFGSALLSSSLVNVLGVNCVYTILLCQVCLQRRGMHWWYMFALTTIVFAFALAIVALGEALMPPREALWRKFRDDGPVGACGGNASPMTYCAPPLAAVATWSTGAHGRYIFALFGSLAYLVLAVDQMAFAFHRKLSLVGSRMEAISRRSAVVRYSRKSWPWVRDACWFVTEAMLLAGTILYFAILLQASPRAMIGDQSAWSFGQLIAVMVWAPTIVKYIYFNIFGTGDGLDEPATDRDPDSSDYGRGDKHELLPQHRQDMRQAMTYPLIRGLGRRRREGDKWGVSDEKQNAPRERNMQSRSTE